MHDLFISHRDAGHTEVKRFFPMKRRSNGEGVVRGNRDVGKKVSNSGTEGEPPLILGTPVLQFHQEF